MGDRDHVPPHLGVEDPNRTELVAHPVRDDAGRGERGRTVEEGDLPALERQGLEGRLRVPHDRVVLGRGAETDFQELAAAVAVVDGDGGRGDVVGRHFETPPHF